MSTETETKPTIDEKIENTKRIVKEYALQSMLAMFTALICLVNYASYGVNQPVLQIASMFAALVAMFFVCVFGSKLLSNHYTFLELLAEKHAR